MRAFLVRLASLFRRRRLDVELDDEVQFHIEMLSQDHMRRREFGVRMALGATRFHILASVIRHGALLAVAGVLAGSAAAAVVTRSLQQFIFGVDTLDAATLIAVGMLLVFVAVAAILVPAIRAVRLNPVSALREG